MSRMLDALRQIETKLTPADEPVVPATPKEDHRSDDDVAAAAEAESAPTVERPKDVEPSKGTALSADAELPENLAAEASTEAAAITDRVSRPIETVEAAGRSKAADDAADADQPIGPYGVVGPAEDEEEGNEDKEASRQDGSSKPDPLSLPTETPAAQNATLVEPTPEAISPQTRVQAAPPKTGTETIVLESLPQVLPLKRPAQATSAVPSESQPGPPAGIVGRARDPQYSDLAREILSQLPGKRPATVLFTSPGDGEGKTTTLAPLSAAMADQMPEEILVVDANFRNPTLAGLLGIETDSGLVDVLTGVAKWQDIVRKTSVDHLSVLPGGRFPSADGTPPGGLDLAPLLTEFRRNFRLVAFDAASLSHPEVAPMSRFFDATYLVLELGDTSQHMARQAVRILDQCGGRLLGCVLRATEDESY